MSNKRQKKIEQREAKAAKKAAHIVEEKQKRPNNLLLAILIFGVLIAMFGFSWGYNYFQKEASIQTYMANNGGKDAFENMAIGSNVTMDVTAKKNNMKISVYDNSKDSKAQKKYYKSEDGEEWMKYVASYYLTSMKPNTRAFSAKATVVANIGTKKSHKKAHSLKMSYKEAEKYMEKMTKEAQEAQGEQN